MEFIKDFVYSIIIVPLTAGNGVRMQEGRRVHDGTISTLAIAVFTIGIAFATIFVTSNTHSIDEDPEFPIRFILITIVLLGVTALSLLWVIFRRQMLETDVISIHYRTEPRPTGLRVKFLWLFCLGLMVRSVLSICIGAQRMHNSSNNVAKSIVRIIWNVLLISFACIQTAFISYFRNIEIVGSLKVHYGMIFIVVANLSIWFDSILLQEQNIFHMKNGTYSVNNKTGIEMLNCTNVPAVTCFAQHAFPYVLPIVAEFNLVSVGFLLSIWSTAKDKLVQKLLMKSAQNLDETSSLLQESGEYTRIDKSGLETHYGPKRKSSLLYLTAGIGVVFVVILLILVLVLLTQSKDQESMYLSLEIYRLVYTILMLFLVFLSYRLLWLQCAPVNQTNPISPSEYILLLSCLGMVMYLVLGIYAGTTVPLDKSSWNVAEKITSLILIYFQTVLIIQANRYQRYRKLGFLSIKNVFILLFVLNLGLWLNDSFLQNKVPYINTVNYKMYGQKVWDFANETLFPIVIFFRFQCSVLFYELHFMFRSNN